MRMQTSSVPDTRWCGKILFFHTILAKTRSWRKAPFWTSANSGFSKALQSLRLAASTMGFDASTVTWPAQTTNFSYPTTPHNTRIRRSAVLCCSNAKTPSSRYQPLKKFCRHWPRTSTSASRLLMPWMDSRKFLSVKSQVLSLPCTRHGVVAGGCASPWCLVCSR